MNNDAIKHLYEQFQRSVVEGNHKAADAIQPHRKLSAQEQLAIYHHGYGVRLKNAIATDYPALLAYLSEPSFDQYAMHYVNKNPSTYYNLDHYPHGFASYIQQECDDTFAGELALLEQVIATVFMGKESSALNPGAWDNISPEELGNMVLPLRDDSRLLSLEYPVNQWLEEQRNSEVVPKKPEKSNSYLYIYRHQYEVQRAALDEAAFILLKALGTGRPIGEVLDQVSQQYPQHMEQIATCLQPWFAEWISKGFFKTA